MPSLTLADLMTSPVTISTTNTSIKEALSLLVQKEVSAIVVVEGEYAVGIITERDITKTATGKGIQEELSTKELMSTNLVTASQELDYRKGFQRLVENHIRHLIVTDGEGRLSGIVTETDFLRNLGLEYYVGFADIRRISTRNVITLAASDRAINAMQLMTNYSISCIVVVDGKKPIGILTERDVVHAINDSVDIAHVVLREVMSHPLHVVPEDFTMRDAAELMKDKGIRRLVMVDYNGELTGLLTETDMIQGLQKKYTDLLRDIIGHQANQLQEAHKALSEKTILDNVLHSSDKMAIATTGLDFCITYFNPAAEKMFGCKAKEVIGITVMDVCAKEKVEFIRFKEAFEIVKKEGEYCYLLEQERNGDHYYIDSRISGIWTEGRELIGFVLMAQDVTERKKAEQQLVAAKQEAERASNAKLEFLSRMSHELRTPLNAISGFSQLLRHDGRWVDENQQEWVEHISEAGEHLLYLVNEVLDIATIESEKMRFSIEDVPLDFVFSSTLMLVRNLALKKGVTLCETPMEMPEVHADARRLKQVMVNLLSNAIKYNHEGGAVTITFTRAPEGWVRINITDTGIGIKPEDQAAVFDPFYRVKLEGETVEGTGIGLSVVKKLVVAMDGRIGVESEYGQGSTFWVELPQAQSTTMKRAVEDAATLLPTAIGTGKGIQRVLYVEDNPANLFLMQAIFKKLQNHQLLSAPDAEQGLIIAQEQHPDLILMDIDLPGMDGFEALERLHTNYKTADIPVIAVSAHAMQKYVTKGIKEGFIDYITKPIQVGQLIAAIRHAL